MKNRIKSLREEKQLTQTELAKILRVSQGALSSWETGRYEPDNEMLQQIADFFGCSVDYVIGASIYKNLPGDQIDMFRMMTLMRTVEKMTTEQFDETLQRGQEILRGQATGATSLKIPVLGSVRAGVPLEAIEDVVDWEEIPQKLAKSGKEYFALQIKGDSMWPDYLPGDIVIVQKTAVCYSGDVCIVFVNGDEATIKQVILNDQDRTMTLQPKNPAYPPRTYSSDEIAELPVTISGVVIELRRKIKK